MDGADYLNSGGGGTSGYDRSAGSCSVNRQRGGWVGGWVDGWVGLPGSHVPFLSILKMYKSGKDVVVVSHPLTPPLQARAWRRRWQREQPRW